MTIAEHIRDMERLDQEVEARRFAELMLAWRCMDLPVFKDGEPFGRIRLQDCMSALDRKASELQTAGFPRIYLQAPVLDALRMMDEGSSSSIAVIDQDLRYCGLLLQSDLIDRLARSITVQQDGAMILLECTSNQFSSSEISRVVEGENAQLLGLVLEHVPDSGRIRANIKINTANAERIIASLQRHGYEVAATFGDLDYRERVEKRYLSLMKYLDI